MSHLSPMDYVISALAQANHHGMSLQDVLRAAVDSRSALDFDNRIDAMADYWIPNDSEVIRAYVDEESE